MTTQNFDSISNGSLPAGWVNYLGTHEVQSGELVCTSIDATNGAYLGLDTGSLVTELSVGITPDGSHSPPFGLFLRYIDLNNHVLCHVTSSGNRIRLVERVNGSNTVIGDVSPSGYSATQTRNLSVEDDGLTITVKLDGASIGISEESTVGQGSTIVGVRSASVGDYSYDNFSYNESASVSKTATFDISSHLQGVPDVYFTLTTIPFSDSITSGTLDTSAATVTLNLDAFSAVDVGDTLCLLASDKQVANDAADIIAWPTAVVAEG